MRLTKKNHVSKHVTDFNLVDLNKIVISDKFKHSDKGFKYFNYFKYEVTATGLEPRTTQFLKEHSTI